MFAIKTFIRGYMECALWSSCGPSEEPFACESLDALFTADDLAPECRAGMRADCHDFIRSNFADLQEYCSGPRDESNAGHDFWLTRNGHGAGFWDRGLGELGERLTRAAEVYRGVDLYPGDDGQIYGG